MDRYQLLVQKQKTALVELESLRMQLQLLEQQLESINAQIASSQRTCAADMALKAQIYEQYRDTFDRQREVKFEEQQYLAFELFMQYLNDHDIKHSAINYDYEDGSNALIVFKL